MIKLNTSVVILSICLLVTSCGEKVKNLHTEHCPDNNLTVQVNWLHESQLEYGTDVITVSVSKHQSSQFVAYILTPLDETKELYKNILDKAGIYLKVNPKKEDEEQDSILVDDLIAEEIEAAAIEQEGYKDKSLEELHSLLEEAVNNEDYEKAAKIRDEISKR